MYSRKYAVHDIAAYILDTHGHNHLVLAEKSHELRCKQFNNSYCNDSISHYDPQCVSQDLLRPVVLSRSYILGGKRGYSCQHGGWHYEYKAYHLLHNSNCRGIINTTVVGYDCYHNESDLYASVLNSHRETDLHYLAEHGFSRNKVISRELQPCIHPLYCGK